jgi:hypothetical protein
LGFTGNTLRLDTFIERCVGIVRTFDHFERCKTSTVLVEEELTIARRSILQRGGMILGTCS